MSVGNYGLFGRLININMLCVAPARLTYFTLLYCKRIFRQYAYIFDITIEFAHADCPDRPTIHLARRHCPRHRHHFPPKVFFINSAFRAKSVPWSKRLFEYIALCSRDEGHEEHKQKPRK